MLSNRFLKTFVVVLALTAGVLLSSACQPLPPAPPGGTASDCKDIKWGSGEKVAARMSTSAITNVRAGKHKCFDRVVVDLRPGMAPGWFVRYGPVTEPATGDPVALRGGASLEVIVRSPSYSAELAPTYDPADPAEAVAVPGFRTFRQVAYAGSFEGQTTFGIGTRARLPYRVFAIDDPSAPKLIVDVAHAWP